MKNFIRITERNYKTYKSDIQNFFIENSEDQKFFHPHGFTVEEFYEEIKDKEKDMYFFLSDDGKFVGYGILRGWDEGYKIPSLGIIIDKDGRGKGYALSLMRWLHGKAAKEGADKVRLTVYKENKAAISLYNKLGYVFSDKNEKELIGIKNL